MISINGRILSGPPAGISRYLREILQCWPDAPEPIRPQGWSGGAKGHAWEQLVLPGELGSRLLWSPSNTGPLRVERQVVTIHDMSALDHPEWVAPAFAKWYRFLIPRLARRVQRILTDSSYSKLRILEWSQVDAAKIEVVPLAARADFSSAASSEAHRIREKYRLGAGPYMLSVSSIEPRKNLHGLLRAWKKANQDLPPEWTLVVAGARGASRVFREADLSDADGKVCLPGFIDDDDLPALYASASAFVYVPYYEGFGLPPLEAMASGVPVICSDRTSLPEVVGDAALLVDPDDIGTMAAQMLRVALDAELQQTLRVGGLQRATGFSWPITAQRTISILQAAAQS